MVNWLVVDKKLIEDVKKGDRKSQTRLYHLCFNVLMSSAYRYHKNEEDAAAVVNAAFLKILTKMDTYNDKVPFKAWIKRIIVNEIIDEFRKNKRRNEFFTTAEDYHKEGSSHSETDYKIEAEYLDHLLKQLPNGTRIVFNLFAIDGFSHKEIAEQLGITVETTKWHMKEARKRLKGMLNQKLAEAERR
ncbi:MAG: RNA polymerase sigma factor [Crocinitomicaceae bacterium]|nr:RNA polymerase sigma factor [Crocinitomicaceae bacterium]